MHQPLLKTGSRPGQDQKPLRPVISRLDREQMDQSRSFHRCSGRRIFAFVAQREDVFLQVCDPLLLNRQRAVEDFFTEPEDQNTGTLCINSAAQGPTVPPTHIVSKTFLRSNSPNQQEANSLLNACWISVNDLKVSVLYLKKRPLQCSISSLLAAGSNSGALYATTTSHIFQDIFLLNVCCCCCHLSQGTLSNYVKVNP